MALSRKELANRTARILKMNGSRKNFRSINQVLHISDDAGNRKDFVVKRKASSLQYTAGDVENILEAMVEVVHDSIRHGEAVAIRGIGLLGLRYVAPRLERDRATGELRRVPGKYRPRFVASAPLEADAKVYELTLIDRVGKDKLGVREWKNMVDDMNDGELAMDSARNPDSHGLPSPQVGEMEDSITVSDVDDDNIPDYIDDEEEGDFDDEGGGDDGGEEE